MTNTLKTITLFLLTAIALPVFAQQSSCAAKLSTSAAFHCDVATLDALNIDVDIKLDGAVLVQRDANGSIATITLHTLAAAVQLDKPKINSEPRKDFLKL